MGTNAKGIGFAIVLYSVFSMALVSTAFAAKPVAKLGKADWTPLFDGKTLKGWLIPTAGSFANHGGVRVQDGAIVFGQGMRTGLAWTGEFPTSNYEVSWEVKLESGKEICNVFFPVGASRCTWIVGGDPGSVVGLALVDDKNWAQNETSTRKQFQVGQSYQFRLRVTAAKIEGWIDDAKLIDLLMAGHTIRGLGMFQKHIRNFGLANYKARTTLRNIRMRRLKAEPASRPVKPPVPGADVLDAAFGGWMSLFDGKTIGGWKVPETIPRPVDGQGPGAHVEGDWIMLTGARPQAGIVWTGAFPTQEYEIELEALRATDGGGGDCPAMVFPVGQQWCRLVVGGWSNRYVALDKVDGRGGDSSSNRTRRRMKIPSGRWHAVRLRVTTGEIEAWVDGRRVIQLARPGRQFSLREGFTGGRFGIYTWNVMIAVRKIRLRSLKPVELALKPPTITPANKHKALPFQARVALAMPSKVRMDLELVLREPGGGERRFSLKREGEVYTVSAVPFRKSTEAMLLEALVEYADGAIRGRTRDRPVTLGGKTVPLRNVQHIILDGKSRVVMQDGGTVAGDVTGLADLPMQVGGHWLTLKNVSRARRIRLIPVRMDELSYTLVARSGKRHLAERTGRLVVRGPDRPAPKGLQPAKLEREKVERKLPASISSVAAGGGGRYLLLQMSGVNKVAVFDAAQGKVVKTVDVPAEALLAAGAEQFLVVIPSRRLIERWSLAKLEKDTSAPIPFDGIVRSMALGCASTGPALIHWGKTNESRDRGQFALLDLETLKPFALKELYHSRSGRYMGSPQKPKESFALSSMIYGGPQIRPSATGAVFGLWRTAVSPMGLASFVVRGSKGYCRYEHTTAGHVVPSHDGRFFCSAIGTFDSELKQINKDIGPCLPSYHPSFIISVPELTYRPRYRSRTPSPPTPAHGAVLAAGSGRSLADLPALSEMQGVSGTKSRTDRLAPDRRFHFIPQANLLVTIPPGDDRLVLRQFDLKARLRQARIEDLIIFSMPGLTATAGEEYEYQVEVESGRGGLRYKLVVGPEGMTLSSTGRLTWRVPNEAEGNRESVCIEITDAADQQTFHTFHITVR